MRRRVRVDMPDLNVTRGIGTEGTATGVERGGGIGTATEARGVGKMTEIASVPGGDDLQDLCLLG